MTSLVPKGYCSIEDIENFLLIDIDPSFTGQVNTWIAQAEKWAENFTGFTCPNGFLQETIVDEVLDGTISSNLDLVIFPRKHPVTSVSSITLTRGTFVISLTLANGAGTPKYNIPAPGNKVIYPAFEFSISGVSIFSSFGVLKPTSFFTKMTYTGGYATVPPDVSLATVNLASDILMRHANKEGLEMITQGRITKRWHENSQGKSQFVLDAENLLHTYIIGSGWI